MMQWKALPSEDEPDWNAEMTIFAKRISRPNQLATLRELESRADVGKVLWTHHQLCIISGLNNDAPIGCMLSFVTGGTGVLLHHRSDNLVFAIILGGASTIRVGERVECKIKGVLQVVDEAKGPVTRKDYEFVMAPAGDALFGKTVNFFGVERSSGSGTPASPSPSPSSPIGFDKTRPLINAQVDMKGREQITENLHTGVKAIDILTPLGRGMNLLVIGPKGSGKRSLALDAILAQTSSGVKCALALISASGSQATEISQLLQKGKVLETTAIVSADEGATIGERLACIFTACSIGERVRDEGGHCLVILDTVMPLVEAWEELIAGLSGLGADKVLEGLVKDKEGREVARPKDENDDNELVDYQGMLVSAAVAQRRGFFSTLFMRPAKLNRSSGGGSMTLLPLVPGQCATGVSKKAIDMSKYQTLSEEQKAKIKEALEKKAREEEATVAPSAQAEGEMATEVIEEFISISDGQLVLSQGRIKGSYEVNPRLSITRVGTRAYPKALEEIAPQVRLDLSQADDARKFSSNLDDPVIMRYDLYARRLAAALVQASGCPSSLGEQVVVLLAIQNGICDGFDPDSLSHFLRGALKYVQAGAFTALQEVNSLRILTAKSEQRFIACLREYRDLMKKIETL